MESSRLCVFSRVKILHQKIAAIIVVPLWASACSRGKWDCVTPWLQCYGSLCSCCIDEQKRQNRLSCRRFVGANLDPDPIPDRIQPEYGSVIRDTGWEILSMYSVVLSSDNLSFISQKQELISQNISVSYKVIRASEWFVQRSMCKVLVLDELSLVKPISSNLFLDLDAFW